MDGYSTGKNGLFYWRTRSGVEVDFIVYGTSGLWAVEVKNTTKVRAEDLRGLTAFGEDYSQATRMLLYRGTRPEQRDGVDSAGRRVPAPVEAECAALDASLTDVPPTCP